MLHPDPGFADPAPPFCARYFRDFKRQDKLAHTIEEQLNLQNKIKYVESTQWRQRQKIFDVEDEINNKRNALIDACRSG